MGGGGGKEFPPPFERRRMKMPNSQVKRPRNGHLKRRYLSQRLEILRAAGREFRVRGFAETGMRHIAPAPAISPPNLSNYFRRNHHTLFSPQTHPLLPLITHPAN